MALKYIQKLYSQHFKRFHYCNIVPLTFKLRYFCSPNISLYTYIYNLGDYILLGAWQYRLEDCFSCLIKLKMLNKFNDEWKDQKSDGTMGLWSYHPSVGWNILSIDSLKRCIKIEILISNIKHLVFRELGIWKSKNFWWT